MLFEWAFWMVVLYMAGPYSRSIVLIWNNDHRDSAAISRTHKKWVAFRLFTGFRFHLVLGAHDAVFNSTSFDSLLVYFVMHR